MNDLLNGTDELIGAHPAELDRIVSGQHHDPHGVLGAHPSRDARGRPVLVIRGWRPDAVDMAIVLDGGNGERIAMQPLHPAGTVDDLYRFWPTLGGAEPALWEQDFDWTGFRWIDPNDADHSVLSFLRFAPSGAGRLIACVANLTPVVRHDHRIGLPEGGRWTEILNSDADAYAGTDVLLETVTAEEKPWNDLPYSASISLPPLGVVWLAHGPQDAAS